MKIKQVIWSQMDGQGLFAHKAFIFLLCKELLKKKFLEQLKEITFSKFTHDAAKTAIKPSGNTGEISQKVVGVYW
jgi:hypothetical protein